MTLPPPNFTSSPGTVRSRSMRIEELGVGEPHAVAGGRPVEVGVLVPAQAQAHAGRSHSASRRSAVSRSPPSVRPFRPKTCRAPPNSTRVTSLRVAGLEADGGAGGDVEPHAERARPVEAQRAIGLEEVEVGAHLDGPIGRVGHVQVHGAPPDVADDLAVAEQVLSRDHQRIGWWMVTSLVPSGNVPSTWISSIISGTPSMTSSRVRTC